MKQIIPVRFYRFVCLCCLRQEIDRSFWKDHVAKNTVYQKLNGIKIADNYKTLNRAALSSLIAQKLN